jgi:oligoendopeptidase F
MMPAVAADSAVGVRWDLARVFADTAAARRALDELAAAAGALRLAGTDPAAVRATLDAHDRVARVADALHDEYGYGALRLSADLDDVEARDLLTASVPVLERVRLAMRSLEQTYGELDDATVASPPLAPYRHYLGRRRAERRHALDGPAEAAFAARGDAASSAWRRLYDDTMTAIEVPFDAGDGVEPHSLEALRALLHHPDRDVRLRADAAETAARAGVADLAAACLDAVIGDRLAEDRLRGHDGPMGATLFTDQLQPAAVEALLHAIERRASIPRDWYTQKARVLGIGEVLVADRMVAVGSSPTVPWDDGVAIAHDVFDALGSEAAGVARTMTAGGLIDAEPRAGKSAGIYCAPLPQGFPSLIQLTYRAQPRDALALAHELGHAVHFELAKAANPWLSVDRSLSMAVIEIPSTTAEIAALDVTLERATAADRKPILRAFLESTFDLVFEASALCRFEQDAAALRAGGIALTADRLAELWQARSDPYFGSASDGDAWLAWPHPYGARFYNYQYAFAFLCSFLLAAVRRSDRNGFGGRYAAMLRAGGSLPPAGLLAMCGLDLADPALWERGLDEVERLCAEAW